MGYADEWCAQAGFDGSEASTGCEADDCRDGAEGGEISVMPVDEVDGFTLTWQTVHQGTMTGLSCQITPTADGSIVEIPSETRHCAASLQIEQRLYFEFFASNPESQCHGWAECMCVVNE